MDRRLFLRAAAAGSLAGLAGCSIASRNEVVVDGPGGPAGTAHNSNTVEPLKRELAADAEALLYGLFSQAAGDLSDPQETLRRWNDYLITGHELHTNTEVTVVWCDFDAKEELKVDATTTQYTVRMVTLGQLDDQYRLKPNDTVEESKLVVVIGLAPLDDTSKDQSKPDRTLWVRDVYYAGKGKTRRPATMLLSSEALFKYFEYRNVYYWERGLTYLVPDARYVPNAWENPTRLKKMVEWSLTAPADWLAPAVESLAPKQIKVIGNPTVNGQRLVVNLTGDAVNADLGRLVSQLTWTLRSEVSDISADPENSPITINVESTEKQVGGRYNRDNVTAMRTADPTEIEAFAILDGTVQRIAGARPQSGPPPLIDKLNKNVEWAAYCRGVNVQRGDLAMAVIQRSGSTWQLFSGSKDRGPAVEVKAGLGHPGSMLQPAFIDSSNLLVVADGTLYWVATATARAQSLQLKGIAAFGVSPEGRRIAYIQNGALFVGSLRVTATSVSIGAARRIQTILSNLTGVAFTAEDWLAVSGERDDRVRVVELSLDGGLVGTHAPDDTWVGGTETRLPAAITSLTAYPDNPLEIISTKRIYVTVGSGASGMALSATSKFESLTDELLAKKSGEKLPAGKFAIHPFFVQ
jgi:hypothetical protein